MTDTYRVAVIPGDGIGKEVVPRGPSRAPLESAASAFDFQLGYEPFDYASADYYVKTGAMLPDGWLDELRLAIWGAKGTVGALYDVLQTWREKAVGVQGRAIDCGHIVQEERPNETLQALEAFLLP